ncbi:MAG: LptF/LptG family permease, partial [Paludibacter sp.]|nr:LptF/LptG family permease [Paludibacter sp.]
FLWKHFADLVGKGIGWDVLAEFFMYAIMTLVPLALPLALLLASLMTFGNLGENFELTAMKSAGISLFRIIRPLMITVGLIVVAAFFFSNNVLPKSQKNMYTLLFSIRHKSPELDVPVGEFYSGINGVNLYVRAKEKGLLKDLMIYDFSNGFDNAAVLLADSGRIQPTGDKKHLLLTLYNGESFENLRQQKLAGTRNIPYRRETFSLKEILYDFDSDFNRYDESLLEDTHVSKNIKELSQSIDSIKQIIEVRSSSQVQEMLQYRYFMAYGGSQAFLDVKPDVDLMHYNPDSAFLKLEKDQMTMAVDNAIERSKSMLDHIQYNKLLLGEPQMYMNRHASEWHRKFALSFACLIFFFIGAPLGAIIRKGGFGLPVVISVLMFVVYYIIDLTGYKMAREGIWEAYQGMWLSAAVLFPIGVFLTYKAAVDATLFNPETYVKFFHTIKIKLYQFIRVSIEDEPDQSK